jgi:hypothetical protein
MTASPFWFLPPQSNMTIRFSGRFSFAVTVTVTDAGEEYTALAKQFPTPPASAGVIFDDDEGRLSEEAFLRDFAGDLPEMKAKVLYAVQKPFHKALLSGKTTHAAWRPKPSFYDRASTSGGESPMPTNSCPRFAT